MGFLQVLLMILKIFGILLACVIGLLLLAVVVVLFVPVRYRLEGQKAEDYRVGAKVSWLLHLVRIRIRYDSDTKFSYNVYLFRSLLLSNDEAWKTEREEKKKKKAEKKAKKAKRKKLKQKQKTLQEKKQGSSAQKNSPAVKTAGPADKQTEQPNGNGPKESQPQPEKEKKKIKQKLADAVASFKGLREKAGRIIDFLKDEPNKAAFGASWTTLVKLLKHIGPTKIKGYLAFGADDPAVTGYVLAVLGIFYGKFGKSFSIRPNFEEEQLEAELSAKGRVRLSRLLYLAWRLWRNKDFKSLLDNIQQLKAE